MRLWGILLVIGCTTPPSGDRPTLPDRTADTAAAIPCEVPLALDPPEVHLGRLDSMQFVASGGTGAFRFDLAAPAQGTIHDRFGAYLAPDAVSVTDTVVLTDEGCAGEATATVTVGIGFEVQPAAPSVLPGTRFVFEVVDREPGTFSCAGVALTSGGWIDPGCEYRAGDRQGIDQIEVTDHLSDAAVEVTVSVDREARMDVWGRDRWALPLGSAFAPRIEGGSGVYDLRVQTGPASVTDGRVDAAVPGRSVVRIVDRFAGFEQDVLVDVLEPFVPDSPWTGQRAFQGRALGPGDLNGDGHPDAIVSSPEFNGGAFYSGAVMVYAGTDGGLEPTPAWTSLGTSTYEFHGRDIDVADLDGDGELDLVVGADAGDLAGSSIGLVRVYRGLAGGFFETTPSTVLRGVYGGDRAGISLATCDFDGDGYQDVAVGAYGHEERTEAGYPTDTGAVFVFRGDAAGLAAEPSAIRVGRRLDQATNTWVAQSGTFLGLYGMAAGDLDGDGDCEVVVSSSERGLYGSVDRQGYLLIYDGRSAADGTLSADPVRVITNLTDRTASLGRSIAVGDVDNDGMDDVVTGAYAWDGRATSGGGVFVFLSASVDSRPATTPYLLSEADWVVEGEVSSNYLGAHVVVADVDGDGHADVMAGEPRGESPGATNNAGRVRLWSGREITSTSGQSGQSTPTLADRTGRESEGYFGQAAAPVGDLDGDGAVDLVVYAGRTDTHGYDVGSVLYALAAGGPPVELEMPGQASGHQHGRAMALFDTDGDGLRDLVVGSPIAAFATALYQGRLTAFPGRAGGGFTSVGAGFADTTVQLDQYDRRGYSLSGHSDVNGDGWADLAVVAYADERPATFDPARFSNPDECPGALLSSAGSARVHLGGDAGATEETAFVFYGPETSGLMRVVDSGFDANGDGFDDLVVSGQDWGSDGGFAVVHGRPAAALATVICDASIVYGVESAGRFAMAVAGVGDLDQDGCDEVVVTAPSEDGGLVNQGIVRVLWGHGPSCASATAEVTALGSGIANAFAGESVAGGRDVDGDGVPDIVVGTVERRILSSEVGSVWLVPGAYVAGLPRQSADGGLPAEGATDVHPLVPPVGNYGVLGITPSGRFGGAVSLVDDPATPGRASVAVGAPHGDEGGVAFAGGVLVYRFDPGQTAFEPLPWLILGGETHVPGGNLGLGLWGDRDAGGPVLLVGAHTSSHAGLEQGAAYVVPLD